jgi:hypothetical protein
MVIEPNHVPEKIHSTKNRYKRLENQTKSDSEGRNHESDCSINRRKSTNSSKAAMEVPRTHSKRVSKNY